MNRRRRPIDLGAVFDAAIRPDPVLLPSEWADAHRLLSSVESGEPGRWRTSRTPYLKEILDRLASSDPVERVVVMKGAQVGGTEVSLNWVGYCIACSPGPMLAVQPTVEMGKRWSKGRLAPMIESTDQLRDLVAPPRERDSGNTLSVKEFPGGIIVITGANSAVGLRSMPVQRLILDEVDGYPGDADDEGDPVDLAVKRTSTFAARRKILMISTPTLKGTSRIERAFLDSDQRRFWVPCPACGMFHVIRWEDIRWPEGEPRAARWQCPDCHASVGNHQKTAMLAGGEWRPSAEGDGKTVGYHLPSLLAPHGWDSWGDIAAEFAEAAHDPTRLQVWVNTRLGEVWEDRSGAQDPEELAGRTEPWPDEAIPSGVLRITVGADTQDDRLEAEVVGWGASHESWSLGYHRIEIPPYDPEAWRELDRLLHETYTTADGRTLRIEAACIDAGGHMGQYVFDFTRRRRRHHVWATFGRPGERPVWQPKAGRSDAHGRAPFHIVGVDKAKLDIFARLGIKEAGPGYCHFPAGRDESWFAGLTSERKERVQGKDGRTRIRWVQDSSVRNEPLDCRVLAYAAILGLTHMVGRRLGPGAGQGTPPAPPVGPHLEPREDRPDPGPGPVVPARGRDEFAHDDHWGDGWDRGRDDGW